MIVRRNIMTTVNPQWGYASRELLEANRRHRVPFLIQQVITGTFYRQTIYDRSCTECSYRTSPPSTFTIGALTVLVLLSLAPHSAKANEGYIGRWGKGPAQCALGQEREDAPLIMTASGYHQYKVHCSFKSVTAKAETAEGSPQIWRIRAECAAGKNSEPYEFTLVLQDNTLTFHDDWGDRVLERCP
jgi:hypothetical protein